MDSRCMTLVGLVVTLTGAILLPPAAYAQINSAAQDKNGYHIYVEVQGFVSGDHVTGFSWDSQANCSNGGNSNCPNSNGTGIAIYALWDWYVNGVHYCVQNCNGFITYAQ